MRGLGLRGDDGWFRRDQDRRRGGGGGVLNGRESAFGRMAVRGRALGSLGISIFLKRKIGACIGFDTKISNAPVFGVIQGLVWISAMAEASLCTVSESECIF
jgi:hypothetical protein